jgi:hypothetical protein
MNERLHKMMMEALQCKTQGYYVLGEHFEKFAELIVNECADVGSKLSLAHPEDIRYQIKKHFGVK